MVGFHVVYDEVIHFATFQRVQQLLLPFHALALVNGVQYGHLFVDNHIGVVTYAFGYFVLALEEVEVGIIYADVLYLSKSSDFICFHISFVSFYFLLLRFPSGKNIRICLFYLQEHHTPYLPGIR